MASNAPAKGNEVPITLYSYKTSPFAAKLELVLLLKGLSYSYCKVPQMPPREALEALGIHYRRIPVLAIANDVYFDTALAVIALEDAFPEKSLKGRNWSLQTASSFFWADRYIFPVVAGLMPWDKVPEAFVKDRSAYKGEAINPEKIMAARPQLLSALKQHMDLIEGQLAARSSPKHFVLDSATPTYLDLSLFFSLNWAESFGTADSIFRPAGQPAFPLILDWMRHLRTVISDAAKLHPTRGKPTIVSVEEANEIVLSSAPNDKLVRTDADEPLLVAKWLKVGDMVQVTPTDNGKVPQKGKLLGLDTQRVVIEVVGREGRPCRVHAPRLGFSVHKLRE